MAVETFDVVIVGGGPGGLAASQQLGARGISSVILERGDSAGWMWHHAYDSLRLHTGKHLSSLPGMAFPRGTPLFPSRLDLVEYLESYVDRFQLPVRIGKEAIGLGREEGGWAVATEESLFRAKDVVVATGIMSSPVYPSVKGLSDYAGRMVHSTQYRTPDEYLGRSILVVGIGNSAAEIASELASVGSDVTVSVRSGANVIPRSIAGIPSQYLGWGMSWLPAGMRRQVVQGTGRVGSVLRRRPPVLPRKRELDRCNDQPVIGHSIFGHISAGGVSIVPGVFEFSTEAVRFTDGSEWRGDTVILATGYRAAMDWMGDYAERDECGFADRRGRVRSARHPGLYFVGHNYDGRGSLYNIRIDAQRIARLISRSYVQ